MSLLKKARLGIRNWNLLLRQLNRWYYEFMNPSGYNEAGVNILNEDWDNLLILDGCRYDLFAGINRFTGRLESRISRGAATPEYLYGNFEGRTIHDTVYITANPQFYWNDIHCEFHTIKNIWLNDGWDDDEGTVLPETVTQHAIAAQDNHPNKRLVIHYMQPHFPFIGSDIGENKEFLKEGGEGFHVWMRVQTGRLDVDRETIWTAYRKNLERALPHIKKALEELRGKTIVTSDHGNLFGERIRPIPVRAWGHPRRIYVDELVQVPWFIRCTDDRRQIKSDPPLISDQEVTDEMVQSRLQDLGYM